MFYRNLLAMEVEEVIRCHPVDGVVLMGVRQDHAGADHGGDLGGGARHLCAGRADA